MYDTGHQSYCSVKTWRDRLGKKVGLGGREPMYAYVQFMLMCGKNHDNTVKNFFKKGRNFTTADNEPWSILFISII